MKKLLILTGDLAAGKTTFSEILAQRYGAAVFQKDGTKELLGHEIGFRDREENLRLSHAAVAVMRYAFEKIGSTGLDVIEEANFHTQELNKLHETAQSLGYDVLTLVFRADNDVLYKRYLARMNSGTRDPVHLTAPLDKREEFDAYVMKGRAETVPGECMTVDAGDFSYQRDESLLRRIDEFMKR